jgi:RNA polymerase sigma factor (sigma-70 family)
MAYILSLAASARLRLGLSLMNGSAEDRGKHRDQLFAQTHWSLVLSAREGSEGALNMLLISYRRPLLIYLTSKGSTPHDSEDILQEFYVTLLRRRFLKNVAANNGRFRSFLLTSLQNFVRDEWRKKSALKRGAGKEFGQLTTEGRQETGNPESAPDLAFERAWAHSLLAEALQRLKDECARSGHSSLCAALEPVMFADQDAPAYREIGQMFDMNEGAVRVAALRIRNRLKALVREQIRQTIESEKDLEDECNHFIHLFSR